MESAELVARAWAPGTDFPPPKELNWLHHLGLAIICIAWMLSLIVLSLRIWCRRTAKQLGIDDALILAAMAINTGWFYTLIMYAKTKYAGIHYWDAPELTYDQQATAKLYEWLIILLYHPILGFVKASVLCFDQKLIGIKKPIRYTVYALQAINAGSMISIFCVTLFQCKPISLNWTPNYKRACINNIAFNYAYNSIVIITDVAVLAVPFWAFMGLQMPIRLKMALLGVFALGIIVTVISCVRLILLVNWFNQFYKGLGSKDIYYSVGWTISSIESNLAIVAASMPALWPMFRRMFPNFFSGLGNSSYPANSGAPRSSKRATGFRSQLSRPTGATRITDDDDAFAMKTMHANVHANGRASTPTGSQDGIIDCKNGIMRTTNVEVEYELQARSDRERADDGDGYVKKKVAYAV